jgi:hypothetical protein
MILQNNCVKPQNYFVKFKDNFLSNVKEYKYLGCNVIENKYANRKLKRGGNSVPQAPGHQS